jgi:hypothetical protein
MAEKRPRWENEEWAAQHVTDQIVCKTCMFRFIENGGKQVEVPDAGCCEIYEYPDSKPNAVYFDGEECEFYEKEI